MFYKVIYIIIIFSFLTLKAFSQQEDSLVINYNYVNSIPQNAELYLNDELIGYTPMHFKWDLSGSKKVIKVKLGGYADMVYTSPEDEQYINKTFKLISLTGNKSREIVSKDKSYSFQKRINIIPIAISSVITVGSAIMAYYFKSKAIEKSDEYEVTGDPALLDKKKQYDVIGGISLAVFQIGLSALIYYHFIDN